ncbi:MAG: DUF2087 domain-containing protein [Clostridium sp.]|uniref:DUF2087 domain-containing protein n=1 Tax=Clostridium sp. TaxID=1506 RepID=UPI002912CC0A|nr:DUF2087 domain-containing protein [Clostridium sp.]MDU3547682.1 DUF2087 domain-containing protein [Clostridium sp.]MDU6363015.1 DUF2087 domain-containing protein [Clostridium sp.]
MELVDEGASNSVNHKIRYFPIKEEKRKALLPRFANSFEPNRIYTEGEVKTIINKVYDYDSLIKRYLVDYGYLKRDKNGEKYCKFEFKVVEKLKKKEGSTQKEALDDLKELLNIWIDSQGDNLKLYNR